MKICFPSLRVLSITLLVTAGQFAAPAHADRSRDGRDGRGSYQFETAESGAYQERRLDRMAVQYAQADQYQQQYPQQYQQFPQPQNAQGGQPRGGRYAPDGAPGNGRGAEYPARSPQYSQEEAERAERERQAERRALLRRQINEARDLYAPVRKP